jgi:hypothetical protein
LHGYLSASSLTTEEADVIFVCVRQNELRKINPCPHGTAVLARKPIQIAVVDIPHAQVHEWGYPALLRTTGVAR